MIAFMVFPPLDQVAWELVYKTLLKIQKIECDCDE